MASHAQCLLYEGARELISSKIGNISHEIGIEEGKATPDGAYIHQLEIQIIALGRLREELDPEHAESIRQVFEKYARGPIPMLSFDD